MRSRLVSVGWVTLIAAGVGVTIWRIPAAARDAQRSVNRVNGLGGLERGLSAGREYDLETDTYVEAARLIPLGATYYVATGTDGITVSGPNVLPKAPVFAGYWLLPRRITNDAHRAQWVFSYGGDLASLGLRYEKVIVIKPGWKVAEVAR